MHGAWCMVHGAWWCMVHGATSVVLKIRPCTLVCALVCALCVQCVILCVQ